MARLSIAFPPLYVRFLDDRAYRMSVDDLVYLSEEGLLDLSLADNVVGYGVVLPLGSHTIKVRRNSEMAKDLGGFCCGLQKSVFLSQVCHSRSNQVTKLIARERRIIICTTIG